MIREDELLEAIAECQGERNPDASTCRNLAAFYTILDHMGEVNKTGTRNTGYSFASSKPVEYNSDSEFYKAISHMDTNKVLALFDEVMDTLSVVNPRLYESIMRRI